MPKPLSVEGHAGDLEAAGGDSFRTADRPTAAPPGGVGLGNMRPPKYSRSRSNSLPVVHGNFVLLHRNPSRTSPEIRDPEINR